MKKSIGVIAEYNPFHNGHLLHLTEARRLAGGHLPVIAVMSGSVVQRGEPAFCNKWARAQMAVQNGADLVLELPAVFSCRSAEFFAAGAVQLLAATGITGYLAFGAETAETQTLAAAAHFINTHQEELRAIIKSGTSYAAAQSTLLQNAGFTFAAAEANDILALEYCRCLQKYAPQIMPLVIRRCGAGYNSSDINAEYASASGIRAEYAAAGLSGRILPQIPECSHKLLETLHSLNLLGWNTEKLDTLVLYKLCMLTEQQIAAACECTEGLEHRLKAAAVCPDMQSVVSSVSSKRYTKSRIRRLLMQLLLGNDKTIFTEAKPQYLRVLAFNNRGRSLLAQMRKTASLPVITKIGRNFKNCLTGDTAKDELIIRQLQTDINAANLLALLQNRSQNYCQTYNSDFLMQPFQQT